MGIGYFFRVGGGIRFVDNIRERVLWGYYRFYLKGLLGWVIGF